MIRKTISLPEEMAAYIDRRVRAGQYGNDSEYFRDLVRRDQTRQEGIEAVRRMVDESLASGMSARTLDEIFEDARTRWAATQPSRQSMRRA